MEIKKIANKIDFDVTAQDYQLKPGEHWFEGGCDADCGELRNVNDNHVAAFFNWDYPCYAVYIYTCSWSSWT